MSQKKWMPFVCTLLAIGIFASIIFLFSAASQRIQFTLFFIACLIIAGLVFFIWQKQQLKPHTTDKVIQGSSILLVDDNKANRRIVMEMLKPHKLSIIEADTGASAIELYKKHAPRLILMDIEMPSVNGLEATKSIRELEKNKKRTPIVAMSAHSSNEKKLLALTTGFDEFLVKPISSEQLSTSLERWFNLSLLQHKPKKQTNFSKITLDDHSQTTPDNIDKSAIKPKAENAALEFILEKSTDASGTIKKVVDVKQSLVFSRNNHDLAKDMLSTLIEQTKADRNNIHALFKEKNWQLLGDLVHKINGGSCYCGVPELHKYTQILDNALEKNNIDLATRHFPDFLKAVDELIEWNEEHDIDIIFDHSS